MGSFSAPKSSSGPAAYTSPYVQDALSQNQQVFNATTPLLESLTNSAVGAYNALAPSAFGANPTVQGAMGAAADLYGNSDRYSAIAAGQNPAVAGIQALGPSNISTAADSAIAGGKYLNAQPTAQLYADTIAGKYLEGNPYLQNIIDTTNSNVTNQANRAFGARGLGAGLSTPYADLLSKNLAANEGGLRYQNYDNERNRQLQTAGLSDAAFANERSLMDAAQGRVNSTNQFNAQQDLARQQALGQLYNQNQTLGLQAVQAGDQARLSAIGQVPGLVQSQYAGVTPALAALGLAADLPFAGINAYNNGVAALTGATNTSSSKGAGLGATILGSAAGGAAAGLAASDRRLKANIRKVGELPDGLGIYRYNYIWGGPEHTGVMADEIERLRPDALGPMVAGFKTVDYSQIKEMAA